MRLVPEPLSDKFAGLKAHSLVKKRLQLRCFSFNFEVFLRTPTMQNICEQPLLYQTVWFVFCKCENDFFLLKFWRNICHELIASWDLILTFTEAVKSYEIKQMVIKWVITMPTNYNNLSNLLSGLQAWYAVLRACNFFKKRLQQHGCFSMKFAKVLRTHFKEHLWLTASL